MPSALPLALTPPPFVVAEQLDTSSRELLAAKADAARALVERALAVKATAVVTMYPTPPTIAAARARRASC